MCTDKRHVAPLGAVTLASTLVGLFAFFAPSIPSVAADLDFNTRVSGTYEALSNVYALPRKADQPDNAPLGPRSDDSLAYLGGIEASYQAGAQRLRVDLQADRTRYRNHSDLDHTGHAYGLGADWAIGANLDGTVEFKDKRQGIPFADTGATKFNIERLRTTSAKGALHISPRWVLQTAIGLEEDDSPRPTATSLQLREWADKFELHYSNQAHLSAVLVAEYRDGTFSNIDQAKPRFHQRKGEVVLDYAIGGLYSAHGALGYTNRETNDGRSPASSTTGAIQLERNLSAKTAIKISLDRSINTYIGTAGTSLDTRAGVNLTWKPTPKLEMKIDWGQTRSEQRGPLEQSTQRSARTDLFGSGEVSIKYEILRWLRARTYARYDRRISTEQRYFYRSTTAGISLEAALR